jgi:hypothetical protein
MPIMANMMPDVPTVGKRGVKMQDAKMEIMMAIHIVKDLNMRSL